VCVRERETDREGERERQTETDRQTDRQTDKGRARERERERERPWFGRGRRAVRASPRAGPPEDPDFGYND